MIPHYLLWKKLQNKHFIVPVKEEWNCYIRAQRESKYEDHMICRVCMTPADIPISEKIDDLSILGAIRAVANIWINETDGFPKYICYNCLEELKAALMFKRKCESSDRKFRKSLPEETVFATRTPSIVFHDFAQIIQDMRNRVNRRAAKRVVKEKPTPAVKKKIITQAQNTVYKCKRCDAVFGMKEQLQDHRRNRRCYGAPCPICRKVVSNIARHNSIVHLRAEKYTCHICGKISFTASSARTHLSVHSDKCDYACPICPYRGKHQAYLTVHMRVHTGERPYLCSMCPSKFVNTSNLKKHQLIHFNKKYQCSRCNKQFRMEKSLEEHYNAAHLHMRYRCSICGRYLCTRRKLLSHERRIHNREKGKLFSEAYKVIVNEENE